ncbi:MAG: mannose-1-phosphate guanylyltransferase/mannose-6-phosphate isomerase [Sphingomonadaceae bacterium]
MSDETRIIPVILSGGSGTRLWPMSTPERPKQFLPLTDERTMFQLTVGRTADAVRYAPPIIVASERHADLIEAQLEEISVQPAALILEPCARNTAPAIALAALGGDRAPLLVMPSDHVIGDVDAFHRAIGEALPLLDDGWLVTFGIEPDGPETGYGYIKAGEPLNETTRRVAQFVEKPDRERAEAMLAAGGHFWNGGIFLFRADMFLKALEVHAPAILEAAKASIETANRNGHRILPDAQAFAASPADSIDYAVMEKADRVAVIPVAMGWSDVGSWDAIYALGAKDTDANCQKGDVRMIDGKGNLIQSDGLRISVSGVHDLIIVASGNEVMILPRGSSQDVKKFSS